MSKILYTLPIIALLAIGALFLVNNNTDLKNIRPPTTFDMWQYCFQSLPQNYCDQLTDSAALSDCYAAANSNSNYVWDGASKELPACQSFYAYFKKAQSGDLLNYNNYYNDCFASSIAIQTAQKSNFFYNQIYGPKYLTCAFIQAPSV